MKIVWNIVLVLILVSAKYREAPAQQMAWSVWTSDSVGINPDYPMVARYATPPIYTEWLHELEKCAKVSMPDEVLKEIQFVEVNAPDFKMQEEGPWAKPSLSMSVVNYGLMFISIEQVYNQRTVKHELLHFALYFMFGSKYVKGESHPPEYFDKCGLYSAEERASER